MSKGEMHTPEPHHDSVVAGAAGFARTHWSIVILAGRGDTPQAQEALEQLCRTYWPPIYAFVRRQGHSPHDAQDLTQEFFARLLARNDLGSVAPAKGRFRSFLLASLKHFLANEWDKARAMKRGGDQVFLSLDTLDAEGLYLREPAGDLSAEKIFDRRWALTLLDRVLAQLRADYVADGKASLFEELKPTLTGERRAVPYSALGARMGLSEGAVKVAVHRLRQRYRELLREEIAQTVSSPDQVEEELRALFAALGGQG